MNRPAPSDPAAARYPPELSDLRQFNGEWDVLSARERVRRAVAVLGSISENWLLWGEARDLHIQAFSILRQLEEIEGDIPVEIWQKITDLRLGLLALVDSMPAPIRREGGSAPNPEGPSTAPSSAPSGTGSPDERETDEYLRHGEAFRTWNEDRLTSGSHRLRSSGGVNRTSARKTSR